MSDNAAINIGAVNYLLGGSATALAAIVSNPLDIAKTKMQLQGEMMARKGDVTRGYRNVIHALWTIGKTEGWKGLQRGLPSAMTYQLVMNGFRLGSYSMLQERFNSHHSVLLNMLFGSASGVLGASIASPIYMAKTRIQSYSPLQAAGQSGHQHGVDTLRGALRSAYRAGGVGGLWAGVSSAQLRVAIGSSAQLASYDFAKRIAITHLGATDGFKAQFASALVSGAIVSVIMCPFDTTVQVEGVLALWKGLSGLYTRLIPHTLLTFTIWEQLKRVYRASLDKQ